MSGVQANMMHSYDGLALLHGLDLVNDGIVGQTPRMTLAYSHWLKGNEKFAKILTSY